MKFFKSYLTPEQRKIKRSENILLIISGLLLGIAFPPMPALFSVLLFVALIPFFLVIERRTKLVEINRAAYLMGFVFSVITLYWVGSWQPKSDPFLIISGILLCFVNPVFFMIPATLYYISRKIFNPKFALFFIPLFWAFYEYLYMLTDASFPWLVLGNGLSKLITFIQAAEIIGALGFTVVIIYVNILLYKSYIWFKLNKKLSLAYSSFAIVILILFTVYGFVRINSFELSNNKIKTGLIQPNLDPWDKWGGIQINELVHTYLKDSREAVNKGAKLIIWPETALPVYLFSGTYPDAIDSLYRFVRENNVSILTGMPHIKFFNKGDSIPSDAKYNTVADYHYATYNSILMINPNTFTTQFYGKTKMVPFGERVPFVDALPFLGDWIKWGVGLSGWNVGKDTTVFKMQYASDSVRINGMICYESIYPFFISSFIQKDAEIIAVVTNDSWYGNSSGPYQHKEYAAFRAIENRKSVVRAANGGISCYINPLGKTVNQTGMFEKTYLVEDVIIQKDKTFFSKYPMVVPFLVSAFSMWVFFIFILKKVKNIKTKEEKVIHQKVS